MLNLATTRSETRRLRLVTSELVSEPQAILIGDSMSQLEKWRAALWLNETEALCLTETRGISFPASVTLALVDVAAERLVESLTALRLNAVPHDLHILVAADRLVDEPQLAGVLPQFRAMACGQAELIQLARRRLTGVRPSPRKDLML